MPSVTRLLCLFSLSISVIANADEPIPVGSPPAPIMSVIVIGPATRDYLPAGKEVDAIDGDLLVQSPNVTFVIANPVEGRNGNLTTNDVGGCLIDLTTTENSADQLTVFRPHGAGVAYRKWSLKINGEHNPIEENSGYGFVQSVEVTVATLDDAHQATYKLDINDKTLRVDAQSAGDKAVPDAEFRLDGGASRVGMSPDKPGEWFWAEDVYWGQAYGIRAFSIDGPASIGHSGRKIQVTGAGSNVAYELACGRTRLNAWANLFRDSVRGYLQIRAPFQAIDRARGRTARPTDGDAARNRQDVAFATASISTRRGNSDEVIAQVRLSANEQITLPVPTGPIAVEMESHGVKSEPGRYHITQDQSVSYSSGFLMQNMGQVKFVVRDDAGWPVPAKIEIRPLEDDTKIDFGPDSAIDATKNVVYIATGERTVALPKGKYELVASHGPEYQVTVDSLEVTAGPSRRGGSPAEFTTMPSQAATKSLTLTRAFDTPGWISADFHSHSTPSGDNTSHQRGRVLNLVCEDIDFAPCTEHNRISSYQSHIDELGLASHILSVSGIELTGKPLPLNHHNVFPLRHTPFAQNGGGPYVADNPDEQVERLYLWDNRSRKVIQQNHPDMGWLLRDRDGNQELDEGFARAVELLDCIEVHPVESVLDLFPDAEEAKGEAAQQWNRGRFIGWLQLLNQGRRLTGVVNTDAHYNYHGSGWLRNWIQVPNDEPAECQLKDIIDATKEGRIVMSNGPMIELTVIQEDGKEVGLGEEVAAANGLVKAKVKVRCANWVHCDRVALLVDGNPVHIFDTKSTPNAFQDGPVVFEQIIDVKVDHDSPIMAICGSKTQTLGEIYGPDNAERHFAAATNPIWINTGDEKWEPSNDPLGLPLQGKIQ